MAFTYCYKSVKIMKELFILIRWILVVILSVCMVICIIKNDYQMATLFGVLVLVNKPQE